MNRPTWEVADIVRKHANEYLAQYGASVDQRRVLRAIANCRTAVLGGHVETCSACDHQQIAYNSCRNRHCPKCQAAARAEWMQQREAELLPVPYFHVVFTLPDELTALALQNPRVVYGILFRAASQTLLEVAANPKHLGAEIGFLAVLHTWGQTLIPHPHLHCVVPSGGLAQDRSQWVAGRSDFFLPVRVLSRVFRGKFLDLLKRAFAKNTLTFHGQLSDLSDPAQLEARLNQSVRQEWVVYAKPPFGGPTQVLKYLARYTHRVAISNNRLLNVENGQVTFRYKDYAQGNQQRTMTLTATEFLRRFLLHVLPTGLMRIRHYGFMANRFRQEKLALCRSLLDCPSPRLPENDSAPEVLQANDPPLALPSCGICPACGAETLVITHCLPSRLDFGHASPPSPHPILTRAEPCNTS